MIGGGRLEPTLVWRIYPGSELDEFEQFDWFQSSCGFHGLVQSTYKVPTEYLQNTYRVIEERNGN